jgi:hypothetical protein
VVRSRRESLPIAARSRVAVSVSSRVFGFAFGVRLSFWVGVRVGVGISVF